MRKIVVGLFALLVIAVIVSAEVHWLAGALALIVPIAITYIRIKLSPNYAAKCDAYLSKLQPAKR